jgi:hypothetical protein
VIDHRGVDVNVEMLDQVTVKGMARVLRRPTT